MCAAEAAPTKTVQITVDEQGNLHFIHDDELSPLLGQGLATLSRASHVEPDVRGEWVADLSPVNGPSLGPFPLRAQALEAESRWLRAHYL